jgi:sRNA-binding regulator protein Hfq
VTTVGLDYYFFLGRTGTGNHLIWFQKYSTLMDKHNISTLMDKHNISTLMDKHNISTLMDKHNVSTELQV